MFPLLLTRPTRTIGGDAPVIPTYQDIVMGVQTDDLIAYFPLNEVAGTVAINRISTPAGDGAYSGATPGQIADPFGEGLAPSFDGTTDFINIYTTYLNNIKNGDEYSISAWAKVSGVGDWTDGISRMIVRLSGATGNQLHAWVRRSTSNSTLNFQMWSGGVKQTDLNKGSLSHTNWMHVVLTNSVSGGDSDIYLNAVNTDGGSPIAWGGTNFGSALCVIGAASSATGADSWKGYISHVAIWRRALTAAEVTTLYNGGPLS